MTNLKRASNSGHMGQPVAEPLARQTRLALVFGEAAQLLEGGAHHPLAIIGKLVDGVDLAAHQILLIRRQARERAAELELAFLLLPGEAVELFETLTNLRLALRGQLLKRPLSLIRRHAHELLDNAGRIGHPRGAARLRARAGPGLPRCILGGLRRPRRRGFPLGEQGRRQSHHQNSGEAARMSHSTRRSARVHPHPFEPRA